MKNVPSAAMENGFTPQLMNSVTPTPFQCCLTEPSAPKSILSSIGTIISQTSTATTRLTRSEEHTSKLQSLMRISYAVFCLKKKKKPNQTHTCTRQNKQQQQQQ